MNSRPRLFKHLNEILAVNEEAVAKLPEAERLQMEAQLRLLGANGTNAQIRERQSQDRLKRAAIAVIRQVICQESPYTDADVLLQDLISDGPESLGTTMSALERVAEIGWEQARIEAAKFRTFLDAGKKNQSEEASVWGLSWLAEELLEWEKREPACRMK